MAKSLHTFYKRPAICITKIKLIQEILDPSHFLARISQGSKDIAPSTF